MVVVKIRKPLELYLQFSLAKGANPTGPIAKVSFSIFNTTNQPLSFI